jgi:uncharacterized membrane protein YeaQ/YmgE (transglycosylase-associated protein family)
MFSLFGTLLIGAMTGYASERMELTRNGYIVSVALGIGGAVGLWFLQRVLGLGLGYGLALTSVIGAALMLFLAQLRKK